MFDLGFYNARSKGQRAENGEEILRQEAASSEFRRAVYVSSVRRLSRVFDTHVAYDPRQYYVVYLSPMIP